MTKKVKRGARKARNEKKCKDGSQQEVVVGGGVYTTIVVSTMY